MSDFNLSENSTFQEIMDDFRSDMSRELPEFMVTSTTNGFAVGFATAMLWVRGHTLPDGTRQPPSQEQIDKMFSDSDSLIRSW